MSDKRINQLAGLITIVVIIMVLAFTLRAQVPTTSDTKLTELEDARYVSAYKTVLLAVQDVEQATARRDKVVQQFNALQQQLRDAHKWPAQTKLDVDTLADDWHSVVTLPPAPASNVPPPATPVPTSDVKPKEKK